MRGKAPNPPSRLSLQAIETGARLIDPIFLNSPQFLSEPLGQRLGMQVLLKVETLNPIRSFKGRGAELFVSNLDPGCRLLVCASAGNFGQALAYASRKRGIRVVVFAAQTANPLKVQRMRQLGAEVHLAGTDLDAAKDAAQAFSRTAGARFVEDGRDIPISEGAGSIAMELCRWPQPIDAVFVPLGNGALLAGLGLWLKSKSPRTRIIGVCAAGAPAMALSWRQKMPRPTTSVVTVADGIAIRVPIPEALMDLEAVTDEILLVEDEMLIASIGLVFHHHGLVIEPAGAAGLAAIVSHKDRFRGMLVATPLCGGNLTAAQARDWLLKSPDDLQASH